MFKEQKGCGQATYELCAKLVQSMKDTIAKYKIHPNCRINMDETQYYWEYLARKVLTKKISTKAGVWKRGDSHVRSTMAFATTANGGVLRPILILKRKTEYTRKAT